jgi:hypothetical protein
MWLPRLLTPSTSCAKWNRIRVGITRSPDRYERCHSYVDCNLRETRLERVYRPKEKSRRARSAVQYVKSRHFRSDQPAAKEDIKHWWQAHWWKSLHDKVNSEFERILKECHTKRVLRTRSVVTRISYRDQLLDSRCCPGHQS